MGFIQRVMIFVLFWNKYDRYYLCHFNMSSLFYFLILDEQFSLSFLVNLFYLGITYLYASGHVLVSACKKNSKTINPRVSLTPRRT